MCVVQVCAWRSSEKYITRQATSVRLICDIVALFRLYCMESSEPNRARETRYAVMETKTPPIRIVCTGQAWRCSPFFISCSRSWIASRSHFRKAAVVVWDFQSICTFRAFFSGSTLLHTASWWMIDPGIEFFWEFHPLAWSNNRSLPCTIEYWSNAAVSSLSRKSNRLPFSSAYEYVWSWCCLVRLTVANWIGEEKKHTAQFKHWKKNN